MRAFAKGRDIMAHDAKIYRRRKKAQALNVFLSQYQNTPYKNSSAYLACMSATTPEELLRRQRYTHMAIEFHEREGNTDQAEFFKSDLELIEQRLQIFEKKGS